MNANAFRHLYGYHFAENRATWEKYVSQLTDEQFVQAAGYSHGSVRDQIIHLINVDDIWLSSLSGVALLEPLESNANPDRAMIGAHWDTVEQRMRLYVDALTDDMVSSTPIQEPEEDRPLRVWQVLLHVVNHGTDHRAQILRTLNDFGIKTVSQDYIFYVYDHLT